jgi:hypothetical protein
LINRLLILGVVLAFGGLVAVPAFAQLLPQGETGVTDAANDPAAPAGGSPAGGNSAAGVIPVELSSELCADVTDPLVVGTFEQVLPEVVQGCQERASMPAGTAPVNPAPVEPAPIDTNPPNQATSVYP